jgi:serine/threonine protein kinase
MEFFTHGDAAVQSYAVDTFGLGLCLLHLLTGSKPYEEWLERVKCPPRLQQALVRAWTSSAPTQSSRSTVTRSSPSFSILRQLLQAERENAQLLCDTLYRYCVLFGLDTFAADSMHVRSHESHGVQSSVTALLLHHLRPKADHPHERRLRSSRYPRPPHSHEDGPASLMERSLSSVVMTESPWTIQAQFAHDTAQYSLATGSAFDATRARMASIPGADALLRSCVHFDPMQRPTMKHILTSRVFASLALDPGVVAATAKDDPGQAAIMIVDTFARTTKLSPTALVDV